VDRAVGGTIVPHYLAYIVGSDGHFAGVHEFTAADRSEAATVALGYVEDSPIELREGEEFIGTYAPVNGDNPIFKRLSRSLRSAFGLPVDLNKFTINRVEACR
jgi:hypothetical protein